MSDRRLDVEASPRPPSTHSDGSPVSQENKPPARTPLPKVQLAIACFVRVTEPIAFMALFPYINQMLLETGVVDDPRKTGFYAGLIESIFAIAELCTVFQWGAASDRWGRKPVLLVGCVGAALSSVLFGFSTNFPMMVITRVINGLANGNVAVLKSVIGELCDETNQSIAFSFFPLSMAIGTILASTIGGYLPHITDQYPYLGRSFPILAQYPYLFPCLVAGAFPLLGGLVAWIWMEETLPSKEPNKKSTRSNQEAAPLLAQPHATVHYSSTDDGDVRLEGAADHHNTDRPLDTEEEDEAPVSFRDLLTPDINAMMTSFGLLQLQGTSFLGLLPLFCFTPTFSGGLSFPSSKIGLAMSIRGVSTIFVQLFAFPWLSSKVGILQLYKALVMLFIPAFFILPICNLLARHGQDVGVWIGLSASMILYAIGNMAFSCNLIMTNEAAPNRRSLGAINGLSQAVSSLMRAVGPGTTSTLFALSVDKNALGGQLVIPVVLTIDEIEYLLDQLPPPDKEEDSIVTKLRERLQQSLTEVRKGAE
ncbi:hypothetical protein B9479_001808 [Cryptococcus floricola]|uniref:Major facilitator superfamily (MFS) profile domain-containing protein n=1 Tax=Cryptococcus floricola TaxID=2591691 RepID=A0A5D3B4L5_9TREE|nr:hypothetical protein B9479_001808 [Cryptococcus floricola]